MQNRNECKAFEKWGMEASQIKVQEFKIKRAVLHMQASRIASAFVTWQANASTSRKVRDMNPAALERRAGQGHAESNFAAGRIAACVSDDDTSETTHGVLAVAIAS